MDRTNEIDSVAAWLGYTEDMGVSALDYIIDTAKAVAMVNKKNVELMAQVQILIHAAERLLNADDCDDEEDSATIHSRMNDILLMTPNQCLNQIKSEAEKDADRINWLSEKSTEKVIQNQSEYVALKTKYEIPTLVAYADFCGQIPFRDAIDIAMMKSEEAVKGEL